jgi:putative transposase
VRAVCQALRLSRSHLSAKTNRKPQWTDGRKSPPLADDDTLRQAIAGVVKDRATYGYRRVWARLRIDGHRVNHKRVYRVMRDEGLLLFRQGHKPMETRKHERKVAVKDSDTRWCSD